MRGNYIVLLLLFGALHLCAQNQLTLDSLKVQLDYAKSDSSRIKTLWEISDYYWADDLRQALHYSEQAMELAMTTKDDKLIGISYQKIGDALLYKGDNSNALKNYYKSLEIIEGLDDDESLFSLYHNMGVLFGRILDFNMALSFYEKALFVYNNAENKTIPSMGQIYTLYNSMGNIYDEKAEEETANEYYLRALDLALKKEDHQALGVIYNNLGKLAVEKEEWNLALAYLQKSLESRQRIHDLNGMAKSYNNLTQYYMLVNEVDEAFASAQIALELSHEAGAMLTRLKSLENLSAIYQSRGELQVALDLYKQYKELNDSLINESSIKKQTELQVKYEYEKEEKVKEAVRQKESLRYILVISVLTFGFVTSILFYSLAKSRSRRVSLEKKSLEQDLDLRNQDLLVKDKELASSVLFLLKKNELLTDVSERLLSFKKKISPDNQNSIQKIILDIQEGAKEDMWEEFEMRFQQVHNDYFLKLKEYAPDLSPGEIKICTFLKLNMTSKEISAITRQSVKSIEVARTRIRKKLHLTNKEVNLVSFLLDF